MNGYSYEYTMNMMGKLYSHIVDSKVERPFSHHKSISYHDTMLVLVLGNYFINMNSCKDSI